MTLKVIQGLVGNKSGFQEIRPGTQSKSTEQTKPGLQLAQQSAILGAHVRTLSDAVVSSVKSSRASAPSSEKIREYKEAKEASVKVADKIRDDEAGGQPHQGLDAVRSDHFSN